ncbi:hypothetical protein ElyMa_005290900 [Elysia marginata]|uniref:Secreted protein n=1 Tax=Elysia marginata TaxID=1093978 RepID=A0AAV4K020_9GAST|nr:hypothetical protein ElyMa_005290900 [Elysia marginata]
MRKKVDLCVLAVAVAAQQQQAYDPLNLCVILLNLARGQCFLQNAKDDDRRQQQPSTHGKSHFAQAVKTHVMVSLALSLRVNHLEQLISRDKISVGIRSKFRPEECL